MHSHTKLPPEMHLHTKFGISTSKNIRDVLQTQLFLKLGQGQGHSDSKMVSDTLPSQDAFTHQIWNSYLKEYRRYAPDSNQFLETRSEVKVNVTGTQGWCATLCHLKMHPNTKFGIPLNTKFGIPPNTKFGIPLNTKFGIPPITKFGIPSLNNIGDMLRTRSF